MLKYVIRFFVVDIIRFFMVDYGISFCFMDYLIHQLQLAWFLLASTPWIMLSGPLCWLNHVCGYYQVSPSGCLDCSVSFHTSSQEEIRLYTQFCHHIISWLFNTSCCFLCLLPGSCNLFINCRGSYVICLMDFYNIAPGMSSVGFSCYFQGFSCHLHGDGVSCSLP